MMYANGILNIPLERSITSSVLRRWFGCIFETEELDFSSFTKPINPRPKKTHEGR